MNAGNTLNTATNTIKEGFSWDSPSRTITDAHIMFFTAITGDMGKSHVDVEHSKKTKLGKPSAHGLLLASLLAKGGSNLRDKPEGFILIEQGCKFIRPAVVGDTLTPQFVVEKIWEEGHRKFCRVKTFITNQRNEVVIEGFQLSRIIPPKE